MRSPTHGRLALVLSLLLSSLAGCGGDGATTGDSVEEVLEDTVGADTTVADTVAADMTDEDTAVADSTVEDTAVADIDEDTAVTDTAVEDTAVADIDEDTAVTDTAVEDTVAADTTDEDTAVADATDEDTAVADATDEDTAVEDTAVADTTVEDTVTADVVMATGLLTGPADAPAGTAITPSTYVVDPADFDLDHPDFSGRLVSPNVLALVVAPGATVGAVDAVLDAVGAVAIAGASPGGAGVSEGLLIVRVDSTTHARMAEVLATLKAAPEVLVAVQDMEAGPLEIPGRPEDNDPTSWTWKLTPAGGNYGQEQIRVPALWNFNDAVRRGGAVSRVAQLDVGFGGHEDFDEARLDRLTNVSDAHGNQVLSLMAAGYDNAVGIDGIDPYGHYTLEYYGGSTAAMVQRSLDLAATGVHVMNLSIGFNWWKGTTVFGPAVETFVTDWGEVVDTGLKAVATGHSLPVLVAAAGNDADTAALSIPADFPAKWGSPWNNAALHWGNASIIVVEANDISGARSWFSENEGTISAPGEAMTVAALAADSYDDGVDGTSLAAPLVAGLVAYLYELSPSLGAPSASANPVRDLLLASAVGAGATPRVDAFAAACLVAGDDAARYLADIDDHTTDGNDRSVAFDPDLVPGDGVVDLRDFRRFRDNLLQAENGPSLSLDGPPTHLARDLNGDGLVKGNLNERTFARCDLNGDGTLDRTTTAFVPGLGDVTDLQVLLAAYADAPLDELGMTALVDSADVHVDASLCLGEPDVASVAIHVTGDGDVLEGLATVTSADEEPHEATVSAGVPATVEVRSLDAAGQEVGVQTFDLTPDPGADVHVAACTGVGATVRLSDGHGDLDWTGLDPPIGTLNGHATASAAGDLSVGGGTLARSGSVTVSADGFCLQLHTEVDGTEVESRVLGAVAVTADAFEALLPSAFTVTADLGGASSWDAFGSVWIDIYDLKGNWLYQAGVDYAYSMGLTEWRWRDTFPGGFTTGGFGSSHLFEPNLGTNLDGVVVQAGLQSWIFHDGAASATATLDFGGCP